MYVSVAFDSEGCWEPATSHLMTKLATTFAEAKGINAKKDMLYIDIGANIGGTSLPMAASGFTTVALEGKPINFKHLSAAVAHSTKVSPRMAVFNAMLYYRSGVNLNFQDKPQNQGGIYVINPDLAESEKVPPVDIEVGPLGDVSKEQVVSITLDDVLYDKLPMRFHPTNFKYTFAKIDIEGSEFFAIMGGRRLFTKNRPVFVYLEFNPGKIHAVMGASVDVIKLVERFMRNDAYHAFHPEEEKGKKVLRVTNKFPVDDGYAEDYVFIADEHIAILSPETPIWIPTTEQPISTGAARKL